MEKFKKIIRLIILGAAILYAGYLIGYWTKYYVYQYKSNPERIYKQDAFGGKTPQETYEMFVSALRLSDIELASKYSEFIVSRNVCTETSLLSAPSTHLLYWLQWYRA